MICVIDADNFFVSCEKLFRPDLNGKPAVVLSGNDGCIVARSVEAKALKIPMGAPLFQVREQIEKERITVFSGNFSLYCDLSDRMMAILRNYTHNLEIYSIDEAFMDVSHISDTDLLEFGIQMPAQILREVGISVTVGIAPTKTLAKIASHIVKNDKKGFAKQLHAEFYRFPYFHELEGYRNGVEILKAGTQLDTLLANTPVEETWGIGKGLTERLHRVHITTCKALRDTPFETVKKLLGINGLRIQKELSGIISYHVSQTESVPKSVMNTRSFGRVVTQYHELEQAVTRYTAELSEKLRRHKITATFLTVYITTKRYGTNPYSKTLTTNFLEPTNQSRTMIAEAQKLLLQAFKPGYTYRKAGIIVSGIISEGAIPTNLFSERHPTWHDRDKDLDSALDKINHYFGKSTIIPATQGLRPQWFARANIRSPRYTTSLHELPRVR